MPVARADRGARRPPAHPGGAAALRARAARVVAAVVWEQQLLDNALRLSEPAARPEAGAAALVQELSYGTVRWFVQLDWLLTRLLARPLRKQDRDIHALLVIGLYQLRHMRVKPYAAVNETVAATRLLRKGWAGNVVNACLRAYLRDRDALEAALDDDPEAAANHPRWLLERYRQAWPDHWPAIIDAANARPPMSLRVNLQLGTRDAYLEAMRQAGLGATVIAGVASAVRLDTPLPVTALPGFGDGRVSVQDAAAQLAAYLLDLQPGQRVLDACAAPGGKTGHILELQPDLDAVVAVERDPPRMVRVRENLDRLGLDATLITADAAEPELWHDGQPFDRILLDAPCSATGVIRRHPDIKLHRSPAQVEAAAAAQAKLLDRVWPLLARGGKLLYATCSILPEENAAQIKAFLAGHRDARVVDLAAAGAGTEGVEGVVRQENGIQILPRRDGLDGFYYACMEKL